MNFRRSLEKAWFTLLLFCFICIGVFRVFQDPSKRQNGDRYQVEEELGTSLPTKHVTLSLININNGVTQHVLFFNRVPKTGSEMLVLLLQWLQGVNGFRHIRLPGGEKRRLTYEEQDALVRTVMRTTRNEAIPVSFDRHIYFVNFTKFDQPHPTYINLVRDPVDKAVSRFYYGRVTPNPNNPDLRGVTRRTTRPPRVTVGTFEECVASDDSECAFVSGRPYDLSIPYFCGQDKQCMILNDKWALSRAKKNVEKYFPVVGVLEELNATLAVLENKLPLFFKGVQHMYHQELLEPHRNANRKKPEKVDPRIRKRLRAILSTEYDFYYWLKARLVGQNSSILR